MVHNYEVGSIIAYTPFGGGTRHTKVVEREDNIKNGRPGFSGYLVHEDGTPADLGGGLGNMVWGYDSQITNIEQK